MASLKRDLVRYLGFAISVPPGMRCEPAVEARPSSEKPRIATLFCTDCTDQIDDRRTCQQGKTEHGDTGRKGDAAGDRCDLGDLLKQGGGVGHVTSEIRAMNKCAWEAG